VFLDATSFPLHSRSRSAVYHWRKTIGKKLGYRRAEEGGQAAEKSTRWLKNLRELLSEYTVRRAGISAGASWPAFSVAAWVVCCVVSRSRAPSAICAKRWFGGNLSFALWRLGGICAQKSVFKRGAVEPANNGVHLLLVRGVDKSKSFGFLRFGVANNFDRVCDQIVCGKP
jgi:hypothetical protein